MVIKTCFQVVSYSSVGLVQPDGSDTQQPKYLS
jgi:hypothetical protein